MIRPACTAPPARARRRPIRRARTAPPGPARRRQRTRARIFLSPGRPPPRRRLSNSAGTYSAAGASAPTTDPAGTYSAAGAERADASSSGRRIFPSPGRPRSAAGIVDPAGTYSAAGASAPTTDPAGTYSAAGASAPTLAAAGTIFPSTGATSSAAEIVDPAGTYSAAGASKPTTDPAGTYSAAKASAPTLAEAGTYIPVTGATSSAAEIVDSGQAAGAAWTTVAGRSGRERAESTTNPAGTWRDDSLAGAEARPPTPAYWARPRRRPGLMSRCPTPGGLRGASAPPRTGPALIALNTRSIASFSLLATTCRHMRSCHSIAKRRWRTTLASAALKRNFGR